MRIQFIALVAIALLSLTSCGSKLDYPELVAAQYPNYQPTDIAIKRVLDLSKQAKCGYVSSQFFEAAQRSIQRDHKLIAAGLSAEEEEFREEKLAKANDCSGQDGSFHVVEFQFPGETSTWFIVFDEKGALDARGEVLKQQ